MLMARSMGHEAVNVANPTVCPRVIALLDNCHVSSLLINNEAPIADASDDEGDSAVVDDEAAGNEPRVGSDIADVTMLDSSVEEQEALSSAESELKQYSELGGWLMQLGPGLWTDTVNSFAKEVTERHVRRECEGRLENKEGKVLPRLFVWFY